MHVFWTPIATKTFELELQYIVDIFGDHVALSFAKNTFSCIKLIQKGLLDAQYSKSVDAYFLVLSKQSTLIYRWNASRTQLVILLFWNNRRNPKNLKKLMSQ